MIQIHEGDCLDVMRQMARDGQRVDAIVTDTPYNLASIRARFGGLNAAEAKQGADGSFARLSKGFMGKSWDDDVAMRVEVWRAAWRVLKPGGWLLTMSGARTQHRMVCAIEDASFEIRDQIGWLYAQGFAKNKAQADGSRIALAPAWEPICVARKPIGEKTVELNLARYGTGSLNTEACRIGVEPRTNEGGAHRFNKYAQGHGHRPNVYCSNTPPAKEVLGRFPKNIILDGSDEVLAQFPDTKPARRGKPRQGKAGDGWGMTHTGAEYDDDGGSAARFFYCAKATPAERAFGHPTVKPVALMRYLVRLVTREGQTVLDPFAGTGQTGYAARLEGRRAILIEKEPEYAEGIRKRFAPRRRIV